MGFQSALRAAVPSREWAGREESARGRTCGHVQRVRVLHSCLPSLLRGAGGQHLPSEDVVFPTLPLSHRERSLLWFIPGREAASGSTGRSFRRACPCPCLSSDLLALFSQGKAPRSCGRRSCPQQGLEASSERGRRACRAEAGVGPRRGLRGRPPWDASSVDASVGRVLLFRRA